MIDCAIVIVAYRAPATSGTCLIRFRMQPELCRGAAVVVEQLGSDDLAGHRSSLTT